MEEQAQIHIFSQQRMTGICALRNPPGRGTYRYILCIIKGLTVETAVGKCGRRSDIRQYFIYEAFVMDVATGRCEAFLRTQVKWQEKVIHMDEACTEHVRQFQRAGSFSRGAAAVDGNHMGVCKTGQSGKLFKYRKHPEITCGNDPVCRVFPRTVYFAVMHWQSIFWMVSAEKGVPLLTGNRQEAGAYERFGLL